MDIMKSTLKLNFSLKLSQYLQKPLNDILQNKTTSELSDSKTSKQIPSKTKDETTTTKSPLKIIKKADKPAIYLSSKYVDNKDLLNVKRICYSQRRYHQRRYRDGNLPLRPIRLPTRFTPIPKYQSP